MTRLDTLRSLQKRIREATGPDRKLDAEITVALTPTKETADDLIYLIVPRREDYCTLGTYWRKSRSGTSLHTAPLLTTYPDGLGACVGLMLEVLPECLWSKDADGYFWIHVDRGTIYSRRVEGEKLANDCLTFIDAICAARIAELEAEQEKERVG